MGTRSKMGWNGRCTVRGPLDWQTTDDYLTVLKSPTRFNRAARRAAASDLRRYARYILKHRRDSRNWSEQELKVITVYGQRLAARAV